MPFKNQQQRSACWAQASRDKKVGKKPDWNWAEWEKETPSRIPGMKKKASDRFTSAFQDELSKLSGKPFMTAMQRLSKALGKKAPVKKPLR